MSGAVKIGKQLTKRFPTKREAEAAAAQARVEAPALRAIVTRGKRGFTVHALVPGWDIPPALAGGGNETVDLGD
jgi:hypothetical protein